MVTINDIAREAGVAKSTVSRYLNGGSVSQKTAEKINFVIQKTGYLPNTFAQSLKAKQTKMVGAITPRLDSYASNTMLSGVESYLRKKVINY
ncbi:LacI family DNA-binding transcriptional regulator [Globicatella sp. PHS-GS-PNBC-21-1553]|uniref:LacI family DNA-binding transcriptional regulator n=1 Tax=Globicatella sp. PHS-GS-PNBC-21-1553 TaxID=2885764 RepID=UPI00298F3DD1|nr:LacI family DNA-binding transcriptional regulator [Globicatella sp. PHS-GS-PNBC-21-1553]WPC09181.1 LacI family transcriptional regulator [Globicatella sp. PHS-GS-PNBC-21-1553]